MPFEKIEEKIKNYTSSIEGGHFNMPTHDCRICHGKAEHYILHECRKRQLRVVHKDIIKVIMTFLLRWKCPLCQCTFTDYPPFIIPHKRFALFDMCQLSQKYLESETTSYRSTVKQGLSDIGYIDAATGLCERFLSHSTIYRFIGYIAKLCPSFYVSRFSISSRKYRSVARKSILIRALSVIKHFVKKSIFPDFETPIV